jgi:hypothetical protein
MPFSDFESKFGEAQWPAGKAKRPMHCRTSMEKPEPPWLMSKWVHVIRLDLLDVGPMWIRVPIRPHMDKLKWS